MRGQDEVTNDPEPGIASVLTTYGDSVDRERLETERRKTIAQHRQDRLAPAGRCIGWLPGLIRVIAAIEQNFPIVV